MKFRLLVRLPSQDDLFPSEGRTALRQHLGGKVLHRTSLSGGKATTPLASAHYPTRYLLSKYLQLPSPKPKVSHNAQPVGGNEIAVLSIGIISMITVTFAKIDTVVRVSLHSPHADSVWITLKYHLGEITTNIQGFQFIKNRKERKHTHIHTLPVIWQIFGRWNYLEAFLNSPKSLLLALSHSFPKSILTCLHEYQ